MGVKKDLVVTVCFGDHFKKIGTLTHPTMERYAHSIGADFKVIWNAPERLYRHPALLKYEIFHKKLHNHFDRILYLDGDVIVRKDCPNLFEIVERGKLGAFNEGAFIIDRIPVLQSYLSMLVNAPYTDLIEEYFNSGVMVMDSEMVEKLFSLPIPEDAPLSFYEQTHLNAIARLNKIPLQELDFRFNRMSHMDSESGESRLSSYIVHYAGAASREDILTLIDKDLTQWEKDHPNYKYKRRMAVLLSGGLGDQVSAMPIVAKLNKELPSIDQLYVVTHYPELFEGLERLEAISHTDTVDNPHEVLKIDALPKKEATINAWIQHGAMQSTDYFSMTCLKMVLPVQEKQIDLSHLTKGMEITANKYFNYLNQRSFNPKRTVLVHPGKGWPSKTFPANWWEAVCASLKKRGFIVAIIGKTVNDSQGVVEFDRSPYIDLVDKLSLKELIHMIAYAEHLVSNDSAPIHIAGAFINYIHLIPCRKHPSHVLPYRQGSQFYKAYVYGNPSFYKMGIDDLLGLKTVTMDQATEYELINFLPEPEQIIQLF